MERFSVQATEKTPSILLDHKQGKLEIKGRSIPSDAVAFYRPLIDRLKHYKPDGGLPLQADIFLDFFNTVSSKCILDTLRLLDQLHQNGNKVKINWYYENGDKDMQEVGIDFQAILKLPFTMISVDEED
ncbi:MAG: DUF1987 domain-containing protein [Bacteroidia bacterium]|jgi:hypothetical protein|nr:DUF1987 domain-containing protein [Bacteroidia bacterium]